MTTATDSERPGGMACEKRSTLAADSDLASVHETANQIADAIFARAKSPDPAKRVRTQSSKRRKQTR